MQVKSILNRIEKHRSFVYGCIRLYEREGRLSLDVDLRSRANARPTCSGCGRRRSGYDTLSPRRFKFVPEAFQTTWERVFRSVEMAVTWGLAAKLTALGVAAQKRAERTEGDHESDRSIVVIHGAGR